MLTAWQIINGHWYFFQSSGAMKTGWLLDKGKWYYLDSNGVMKTGLITVDGKTYLLGPSGAWITEGLGGKVIVIDPGHGGHDPGATAGGAQEKDINLAVGLKLRDILQKSGVKVYMTRSTDVFISLDGRVEFSNKIKPDAYISIHVNSTGGSSVKGIETFYNSSYGSMPVESKLLATDIQSELLRATGAVNRGVKDANFRVTRGNHTPAVLVEVGFISNEGERANLLSSSYQNKLVSGIYNGIEKYFK